MAQDLRAAEHGPVPHWKKGFKTPVFLTQIAIDYRKLLKDPLFGGSLKAPGKTATKHPYRRPRYRDMPVLDGPSYVVAPGKMEVGRAKSGCVVGFF